MEKQELKAKLDELNVEYDGRWNVDKLREVLEESLENEEVLLNDETQEEPQVDNTQNLDDWHEGEADNVPVTRSNGELKVLKRTPRPKEKKKKLKVVVKHYEVNSRILHDGQELLKGDILELDEEVGGKWEQDGVVTEFVERRLP